MSQQHSRQPQYIDEDDLYIGEQLREETVGALWENYKFLNNWYMQGPLFHYSGVPDNTVNLGINNNTSGIFCPIIWVPERADSADRQFGLRLLKYPEFENGVSNLAQVIIYDDFPAFSTGTIPYTVPGFGFADIEAVYGDHALSMSPIEVYAGFGITPDTGGSWKAIGVGVNRICVAGLSICEMPTQRLTNDNARGDDEEFKRGAIIRGYDSTGEPSLGHLRHWIGSGSDDNADDIERNTRRCLFQWGHHTGVWSRSTSSRNLFESWSGAGDNFTFRIKSRNLLDKTSGYSVCYPAIVVADAPPNDTTGCTIVFTSQRTSDTWTYTFTGAESGPTLIKYTSGTGAAEGAGGGLRCFSYGGGDYDEISITVQCATNMELVIKTVSLWESEAW